ncbi:Uncharacterised protein [Mycobacteroides abscessus subsp. abscessus]|nr:Uncharacterised protein [Mycobacteroides abscessus subsp. abscessus]
MPAESSVRTALGRTAVMLTPVSACSRRVAAVSPTAAYLLALYIARPASGNFPASEHTLTMWPRPRSTMPGSARRIPCSR